MTAPSSAHCEDQLRRANCRLSCASTGGGSPERKRRQHLDELFTLTGRRHLQSTSHVTAPSPATRQNRRCLANRHPSGTARAAADRATSATGTPTRQGSNAPPGPNRHLNKQFTRIG
ncbi:hypothetical protein GCM10010195_47980 [Kitasatospora griseola]|nr:hypothetical protein GCM10010195_47980 [Kitasatospora griseola]